MKKIVLAMTLALSFLLSFSQTYSLKGYVCDALSKEPLPGASVVLGPNEIFAVSGRDGGFSVDLPEKTPYTLEIRFTGYGSLTTGIILTSDTVLHFHLETTSYSLNEVVVRGKSGHDRLSSAITAKEIDRSFFMKNNSASFSKSLSKVAGVSSMDIGANVSKPVIRGLGFNRIAVADKGIVQQNQQWGADHGLDIDQYDVDRVFIHKGPLSLFYGSDAIGGVIEILPVDVPSENTVWGDVSLIAKSNNNLSGITAMTSVKRGGWFFRGRLTAQRFADYCVPADTVTYLTWKLPLYGRRMKNTAGRELNAALSANYGRENISSWTHVSNVFSKNGFFPGSHGIPDLKRLTPDGNSFNIAYPYSTSNHFKISNGTEIGWDNSSLHFDIGFQQNNRDEWSKFHTHYGNQAPPQVSPDLELSFSLQTLSVNSRLSFGKDSLWTKTAGLSAEVQRNRVGGYSFLMPDFERYTAGAFAATSYKVSPELMLTGGVRFDSGKLNIRGFYDDTLADFLRLGGYDAGDVRYYAWRADALKKNFHSFSGALGAVYDPNRLSSLKINIGRSFRFPTANELASNGVHHGAFRHEKGNNSLKPETGWQYDLGYSFRNRRLNLSVNHFASYFPNYIYLNPTGQWSVLPHAGQIYEYTQSRVFLAGGELEAAYRFTENLLLSANWEYVYNRNIDNGYPLPFSPPVDMLLALVYSDHGKGLLMQYSASLENQTVFAQDRIANNEEKTPGTSLFNLLCSMNWKVSDFRFFTDFQVQNVFDTPFYNHLSYYRKLNIPEPGRNIQFILKIPF